MHDDRTRTAVKRQLRGLGLPLIEVTILRGEEHRSVSVWTVAEILERLPNLKRANKAGANLYLRAPRDSEHDLILIDDIDLFTPDRMKAAGHAPAVTIETSPGNLQAWVKLGTPCSPQVRHEASRVLAGLYGGDPGAVDPHQNGRMAGFTNRKPQHKGPRGFPFVLLHTASGKPGKAAAALITTARKAVDRRAIAELSEPEIVPIYNYNKHSSLAAAWSAEYSQGHDDLSAVDWSITHRALAMGIASEVLIAVLANVAYRKGKHAESYARRTVANAVRQRADQDSSTKKSEVL